jgi:hypothetical protein
MNKHLEREFFFLRQFIYLSNSAAQFAPIKKEEEKVLFGFVVCLLTICLEIIALPYNLIR